MIFAVVHGVMSDVCWSLNTVDYRDLYFCIISDYRVKMYA